MDTSILFHAKGLISDLDGTLLDTEPLYFGAYEHVAAQYGKQYSFDIHRNLLGRPEPVALQAFMVGTDLTHVLPDELRKIRDENFHSRLNTVTTLPGAATVCKSFKLAGLPTAIATSSTRDYVNRKMRNNKDLFDYIDVCVCSDDTTMQDKKGKPSPDIYLTAAKELGLDPRDCVAMEDSLIGLMAAKAAGMFTICIPDPRLDLSDVKALGPDIIVSSLDELDMSIFGL